MFQALKNLFGGRRREGSAPGSRGLPPASPAATLAGDPRALKVGDVVNHDGSDFIVEGTLRFDEGELEVVEWHRQKGLGLEPGPKAIEHEGISYALEERGRANYTSEGVTGALGGGVAEYADYAADDRRLGFERYTADGDWEVSLGRKISPHALDIYPSKDGP